MHPRPGAVPSDDKQPPPSRQPRRPTAAGRCRPPRAAGTSPRSCRRRAAATDEAEGAPYCSGSRASNAVQRVWHCVRARARAPPPPARWCCQAVGWPRRPGLRLGPGGIYAAPGTRGARARDGAHREELEVGAVATHDAASPPAHPPLLARRPGPARTHPSGQDAGAVCHASARPRRPRSSLRSAALLPPPLRREFQLGWASSPSHPASLRKRRGCYRQLQAAGAEARGGGARRAHHDERLPQLPGACGVTGPGNGFADGGPNNQEQLPSIVDIYCYLPI